MAQISGTSTKHLREIALELLKEIARERVRGGKVHILVIVWGKFARSSQDTIRV